MMGRRGLLAVIGVVIGGAFKSRPVMSQTIPMPREQNSAGVEAGRQRMLKAFPYRYVTVPGANALAEWERLRRSEAGWPIIIGDDEQLEALAEQFSLDDPQVFPVPAASPYKPPPLRSPDSILSAAANLRMPQALTREEDPEAVRPAIGKWLKPGTAKGAGLTIHADVLSDKPFQRVHIVIVPTARSWEVPAHLRWGGWNECPAPEVHVAALRNWHERYGADLIAINRDTMNLRVRNRPSSQKEALALAKEQFLYCEDIVLQGVETLAALGSVLRDNDWWYFWWD